MDGAVLFVLQGASGKGDGSSWADAYPDLAGALAVPGPAEIWVGRGLYLPPTEGVGRNATFTLSSGKQIYGGFSGVESRREERDPSASPTVLSGDLGRDDDSPSGSVADNAYHVLTAVDCDATTLLDGLIIERGAATASSGARSRGGGLFIQTSDLRITNCVLRDNQGHQGGGAAINGGAPVLASAWFLRNRAIEGNGGAIAAGVNANVRLVSCRFEENAASASTINPGGGAVFGDSGAEIHVEQSTFLSNSASSKSLAFIGIGGGISHSGRVLSVRECQFLGQAANVGGAVWTGGGGVFLNCLFSGNRALVGQSNPEAGGVGGAVAVWRGECSILSSTLARNEANDGGGVFLGALAQATIENSILWGNLDASGPRVRSQLKGDGSFSASYSCIDGLFEEVPGEPIPPPSLYPGCTDADPVLVSPTGADGSSGTEDDDLRVRSGSPAVDAGRNAGASAAAPFDLRGGPRFSDDPATPDTGVGLPPLVDMGAYELDQIVELSLRINDGALFTTSPTVTLSLALSPPLASHLQFSNDGIHWNAWEPFTEARVWLLPGGEGVRRVQARAGDASGKVAAWAVATILLDLTPPVGSLIVNHGAASTATPDVSLSLDAEDATSGVDQMRLSTDDLPWEAWEPFASERSWSLPPVLGAHVVRAQLMDRAGHVSAVIEDAILLETTGPCSPDSVPPTVGCPETVPPGAASAICLVGIPDFRPLVAISDNCSPVSRISVFQAPEPGALVGTGITEVVVTAIDEAGNTEICSLLWDVQDHAFLRGNINNRGSHRLDLSDALDLAHILFGGLDPGFQCSAALDVDNDGQIDLTDLMVLLRALLGVSGSSIPPPRGSPAVVAPDGGQTPSALGCPEGESCS